MPTYFFRYLFLTHVNHGKKTFGIFMNVAFIQHVGYLNGNFYHILLIWTNGGEGDLWMDICR